MTKRLLTAGCALLLLGCGSRPADPTADLGVAPTNNNNGPETPTPAPPPRAPDPDCPKAPPLDGDSCAGHEGLRCKYVRAYCPDNPMGPSYHYERDIWRCINGQWHYEGQDCYDCCRPRPWWTDGGIDDGVSPDVGPDGCIPPAPAPGCDYCGKLVCPAGSSIDSSCKCYDPEEGYVTPVSQSCDFCCGKVCAAGQFLDYACSCYTP